MKTPAKLSKVTNNTAVEDARIITTAEDSMTLVDICMVGLCGWNLRDGVIESVKYHLTSTSLLTFKVDQLYMASSQMALCESKV